MSNFGVFIALGTIILMILCIFAIIAMLAREVVRFANTNSDKDGFSSKNNKAKRIFESGFETYDEVSEYIDSEDRMFFW